MDSEGIPEHTHLRMKFKLGFDFQEGSGLCPWALENYNLQKKPLFFFEERNISEPDEKTPKTPPLWHVVLDTSDIEFVTRPFIESKSLKKCVSTIQRSLRSLQELLKRGKSVSFIKWAAHNKSIGEKESCELVFSEHFPMVKERLIIQPSEDWKPTFSPQVTIQHPLEYTIFLYFGLFGFKDSSHMMPFVASLPFSNLLLQVHEEADSLKFRSLMEGYKTKVSGLTFLHALTLVQMTPDEDDDDSTLLAETKKTLTDFLQVDAKMRLTLMSRRPFSSMLKDIKLPKESNYPQFFFEALANHNQRFLGTYNVPNLFYRANYAEQHFDPHTGKEISQAGLLPLFRESFMKENRDVLEKLLARGVVSTVMIRNLAKTHLEDGFLSLLNKPRDYFTRVVESVAVPKKRHIIDKEKRVIRKVDFAHDVLSPPEFLDLDNSMGAFKEKLTLEELGYGEAIVEVRGIKNVQDWFFRKVGFEPRIKKAFLTIPGENLIQEAVGLFEFLEKFGTPQDIEDIQLGMTYAVFRN